MRQTQKREILVLTTIHGEITKIWKHMLFPYVKDNHTVQRTLKNRSHKNRAFFLAEYAGLGE